MKVLVNGKDFNELQMQEEQRMEQITEIFTVLVNLVTFKPKK